MKIADTEPVGAGSISAASQTTSPAFGIAGSNGHSTAAEPKSHLLLQDAEVRWILRPVADSFGGTPFRWDLPELKLTDRVDAVAYAGEEKALNLSALSEAFVCFALEEWPYEQKQIPPDNVEVQRAGGRLRARWSTRGKMLELDLPVQPGPFATLNDSCRSTLMT